MTRDEAIELILGNEEARDHWNALREQGVPVPSLAGVDLKGARLKGSELVPGWDAIFNVTGDEEDVPLDRFLPALNLRNLDLRGANLQRARLWCASVEGTRFDGADLRHANLEGAFFCHASLRGSDLRGANFGATDFRMADLRGASAHWLELFEGSDVTNASGLPFRPYRRRGEHLGSAMS